VQLAVDDSAWLFELELPQKFSMDVLKIDQSFVRQITTLPKKSIVTAMISMAEA